MDTFSDAAANNFHKLAGEARVEYEAFGETSLELAAKFGDTSVDLANQFNGVAKDFISEGLYNNYKKSMIVTGLVVGGMITTWYGSKVLWNYIDRTLKRPRLIIKSSRVGIMQQIKNLFSKKAKEAEMIFVPEIEAQLNNISKVTQNINKKIRAGQKNVKYRNLLLWGAPGTGKTMFAEKLARTSGMEFVQMSGSSFSKFKKGEGIIAMDELFAWAKRSKKGLMIFIDEAESFLSERTNSKATDESYQILNNFLNYTGTRSDKFMLVFATNHPKSLDSAMERRIDDAIEMKLPGVPERSKALALYRDKVLLDEKQNSKPFVTSVKAILDDAKILNIAEKIDGFSYGDIEGIINTIKTDADATDDGLITYPLVDGVVAQYIKKHDQFAGKFGNN